MKQIYETPQLEEFNVVPMASLLNDNSPIGGGEGGSGEDY